MSGAVVRAAGGTLGKLAVVCGVAEAAAATIAAAASLRGGGKPPAAAAAAAGAQEGVLGLGGKITSAACPADGGIPENTNFRNSNKCHCNFNSFVNEHELIFLVKKVFNVKTT